MYLSGTKWYNSKDVEANPIMTGVMISTINRTVVLLVIQMLTTVTIKPTITTIPLVLQYD